MSEPLIKTPCVFGENGSFVLERELGSGGMGSTYLGRDKMLDRPVAVKVMTKELGADAEFVEKFKKEAQSVARLIHPNIAQIYSYGICDGMPYIAMELVAGGSLYTIMNAHRDTIDVARVIKICQQVAQALQCASDQGFVHGDVKPENILLDANGNAKLIDFGLAAMQKDTTEIWGTPYYISPEKVKKEPVDFRADMYSLGGTLYHALTGVAPFEGPDSIAVVKKRFEGAPKKPSEIRPDLTPAIDKLVLKLLSLKREDRYPSFEALIEAFKDVLTSGLVKSVVADSESATPAKKPAASGSKRMMTVRGRRMMLAKKRPTATVAKKSSDEEKPDDAEPDENEDISENPDLEPVKEGKGKKRLSKMRKSRRIEQDEDYAEEEDEEEGGGIGVKVGLFVVGGILLVGGIIGGLVWYQVADKKAREADEQNQIAKGIEKARTTIEGNVQSAIKFADEFDAFASRAIAACQKPTDELMRMLPEDQAMLLKPAPTKELLDAIASTNVVEAADASATNGVAGASGTNAVATATGKTNAPPASASASAAPARKIAQFRPPTEAEMDPASPEGEKYEAERQAWIAEQKKKKGVVTTNEVPAAAEAPAEEEKPKDPPCEAVIAMIELWERAYGCQASAIRIRMKIRAIEKKGAEAANLTAQTKEVMEQLGALSGTIVEMLDQVKTSKDVENVRKGITFIKSKGDKTVDQTVKRLRREKLEDERKRQKEREAQEEKERLERLAKEKKERIDKEISDAKSKFDAIVTQGCFRQLDWKSALRMLTSLKAEMTTPEGQLACDLELRKVNDMKMVHDIFIKNLKGYTFRGKLKNCTVTEVNEKELVLVKKGSPNKIHILWQKFYNEYPGNLNELLNLFVINTRKPDSKYRITSLLQWADAMTGASLTMTLVCPEVTGAIEKAKKMMSLVVGQYSEYEPVAKRIFPDMSFSEEKKEE